MVCTCATTTHIHVTTCRRKDLHLWRIGCRHFRCLIARHRCQSTRLPGWTMTAGPLRSLCGASALHRRRRRHRLPRRRPWVRARNRQPRPRCPLGSRMCSGRQRRRVCPSHRRPLTWIRLSASPFLQGARSFQIRTVSDPRWDRPSSMSRRKIIRQPSGRCRERRIGSRWFPVPHRGHRWQRRRAR